MFAALAVECGIRIQFLKTTKTTDTTWLPHSSFFNNSGFHGAHLDKSLALNFENDFSKCSLKRDFVQILLNWGSLGRVVEK